jgi:hypothetical protein
VNLHYDENVSINDSTDKSKGHKENRTTDVKNILILINSSWGEIDWILPICYYIKKNYPKITMSVLFNHLDSEKIMKGNKFLRDLLSECVHNWYNAKDLLPPLQRKFFEIVMWMYRKFRFESKPFIERRFFKLLFKRLSVEQGIMDRISPDVLIKDTTFDDGFRKKIISSARRSGCREVIFPHASALYNYPDMKPTSGCYAEDILCNTKWMTKMFPDGNEVCKNKIHVFGVPRYDDWWIQYLQSYWEKSDFIKKAIDSKLTIFLFFTEGEIATPDGGSEKIAEKVLREVIETVLSFQDSFLIIKPHPRQNLRNLNKNLEKYDKNRWVIDQSQAMCLSSIADVLICMDKDSVILDSLAVGKPTIEYVKYSNVRYITEYKDLGLVVSVNNVDQLKNWIERMKSNPDKERKLFIENFRKIFPKIKDEVTKKAVDVVLGLK